MPFVALAVWPFVSLFLFQKLGQVKGLIWSIIIGSLFLPEAYDVDLPGLPPLNKVNVISFSLVLGYLISRKSPAFGTKTVRATAPVDPLAQKVIFGIAGLLLLSSLITVLNNAETLRFGPNVLRGLGLRDLITMTNSVVVLLVPFVLAQKLLAAPEAQTQVLRAFVFAGLGYSLLILFEARMSPQLHTWIYGYFQHGWQQHVRGGHFRPIVFMPHGLWVGMLLLTCVMAAFTLLKSRQTDPAKSNRMQFLFAGLWLGGVLFLSRNFGAVAIAVLFVPILWIAGPRLQTLCAVAVAVFFLSFPILRQTHSISLDPVIEFVAQISPERASSLAYRVTHEDAFLERAALKPATGWGLWGRWRIYDPVTGEDVSTSDGRWMSMLGERGWFGFIGYFGLLTAPILLLLRTRKHRPLPVQASGLAMILAATLIYQMPNNTIGPLVMLLAGALAGYTIRPKSGVETELEAEAESAPEHRPEHRPGHGYTRFPKHTSAPGGRPIPALTRRFEDRRVERSLYTRPTSSPVS